jgi:hypothetical protein
MSKQSDELVVRIGAEVASVLPELAAEIKSNVERDMPVDTGWARANVDVIIEDSDPLDGAIDMAVTDAADYVEFLNQGRSSQADAHFIEAAVEEAFETVETRLEARKIEL